MKVLKLLKKLYEMMGRCEFCKSKKNVGSWTGEDISMCEKCYQSFGKDDMNERKKKRRNEKLKELGV